MATYTHTERRAVFSLAGIFSLRMVGLFMILPVFAVYGARLQGATPFLVGLAVGAYGLAQLLLQIPFGLMADRFDRRMLIIIGLVLFMIGGAVAACSDTIWGVVAGRFLQGAGSISAVVMALLSDLVRDDNRTKAMATVGMMIGVSFAVAFVIGPLLASWLGLAGLFGATTVMGALAVIVCLVYVPRASHTHRQLPVHYATHLKQMLALPELVRLNVGIFSLHLVLTSCFVALPPMLVADGLPLAHHGWLYLPVMVLAFIALVPAVIIAEKQQRMREVYLFAIALLALSLLAIALAHHGLVGLIAAVALFFFAFNLLEALLPSLVSKMSPPGGKGTAMGIYSTSQFLGAFLGGMLGGGLAHWHDAYGLFALLFVVVLVWIWRAYGMAQPTFWQSVVLHPEGAGLSASQIDDLRGLPGVEELVTLPDDAVIYLKVDRKVWQEERLAGWPVKVFLA